MRAVLPMVLGIAALAPVVANGEPAPAASVADGEALFAMKCAACHGRGGWGTRALAKRVPPDQAELLQRPGVPAVLVRYAVRHGVGSMPQFTPTDLTDDELERLAQWLEARR